MKLIAFNGSPRKNGNTATLLKEALEGAKDAGASVELVHLYSLDFKGCTSCFKCKRLGGDSYGTCAMKDELTPILDSLAQYDALIVGTPIYFGTESGETRSFLERLLFPFLVYDENYSTLFPKKIPTAIIHTMNVNEEQMEQMSYPIGIERTRSYIGAFLGSCESLVCNDTFQFSDYSKYMSPAWDPEAKAKRKAEVFPEDCRKARELGARLIQSA